MTALDDLLPVIFMSILGLAMLVYVVLDGYDLGVGLLMPGATEEQKDIMIASIGPFWDANETWLVLGVGVLLIAFPKAHGMILGALYLPVVLMLVGLILRGVASDFRVKAHASHRSRWNQVFTAGSAIASVAQGWMLGRYVTGLRAGWPYELFAAAISVALPAAYLLLGAGWLILKTSGPLQILMVDRAKRAWPAVLLGIGLISAATPLVSPLVRSRWFQMPDFIALLPIPLVTVIALFTMRGLLNSHRVRGRLSWAPFGLMVIVLVLGFFGLAYSIYPFVVIDRLTIWQAASSPAALKIILTGVCVALPAIIAYTVLAYRVFRGKATTLRYA